MKRYLIAILATTTILPTICNSIWDINFTHNKNNNFAINFTNVNNNSIDWTSVQSILNKNIKDGTLFKNKNKPLGNDEKQQLLTQVNNSITDFKTKKINNNQELKTYIEKSNPDFKTYYNNPEKEAKSLNDKIVFQYFNNKKIDLNLDGSNTYQDVVNILLSKINSQYGIKNNIKLSLVDNKQAKSLLFDDKNIAQFVNNNLQIKLNFQIGNNKVKPVTLKLTNIQLATGKWSNDQQDSKFLWDAVSYYFKQSNPQELGIKISDTRQTALNKALAKIKTRFSNYDSSIKITITNTSSAQQTFINDSMINSVINEDSWFSVNLVSNQKSSMLNLYLKLNLDFLSMNEMIDSLFLSGGSEKNLQALGLSTDNTFQNVVDTFNKRLHRLDPNDKFQVYLTDLTQSNTKLEDQYNPAKKDQSYKINVGFEFYINNTPNKMGTTDLYLGKVTPGQNVIIKQKAYDHFLKLTKEMNLGSAIANTIEAVAIVGAAVFLLNPSTFAWAIGCTILTSVAAFVADLLGTAQPLLQADSICSTPYSLEQFVESMKGLTYDLFHEFMKAVEVFEITEAAEAITDNIDTDFAWDLFTGVISWIQVYDPNYDPTKITNPAHHNHIIYKGGIKNVI